MHLQQKTTFKIMMMNLLFLKKLFVWIFYLLVLTILCKVKVRRHRDVYFETECPNFGSKKKNVNIFFGNVQIITQNCVCT